VLLSSHLSNIN